jgi:hypothetical protein
MAPAKGGKGKGNKGKFLLFAHQKFEDLDQTSLSLVSATDAGGGDKKESGQLKVANSLKVSFGSTFNTRLLSHLC